MKYPETAEHDLFAVCRIFLFYCQYLANNYKYTQIYTIVLEKNNPDMLKLYT